MVYVRVRKNNSIDFIDRQRKQVVLRVRLAAVTLKHSAVEQDGMSVDANYVTGARNFPGGTYKCYFHPLSLLPALLEKTELSAARRPATCRQVPSLRGCAR
jgi:hypothetical protein